MNKFWNRFVESFCDCVFCDDMNCCFLDKYTLTFVCVEDAIKQEPKDHSSHEWVSPVPEVEVGGSASGGPYVRARKDIPRGARFGPFLGKWASEPFNPRYAWEVSRIFLLALYTDVCTCLSFPPAFEFSSGGSRGDRKANSSVLDQFELTFWSERCLLRSQCCEIVFQYRGTFYRIQSMLQVFFSNVCQLTKKTFTY